MSQTDQHAITIATTDGTSRIVVAPGMFAQLGEQVRLTWPQATAAWLITDATVGQLHGAAAARSLAAAGLAVQERQVPAGEASKSLAQASALYDWLFSGGVERGHIIIALGGGVVGDLAGFVAATCLRGLPLVQVPTSLLAMVDSSVGGKTGINHAAGKNLIGAFYQPPLVIVDPRLLATLPSRELAAGWAEVIKYGFIERSVPSMAGSPPVLLPWLEEDGEALRALEPEVTTQVVRHCIALKASVVEADPTERGLRAILNYGHTIGHAVEAAAGYGQLLHGEAVAVGMHGAARLGVALGRCKSDLLERQQALIRDFGLPERVAGIEPAALWPYMRRDKKAVAGSLKWILPTDLGMVEIVRGVDEAAVNDVLVELTGALERGRHEATNGA